jgi:spore maturation protein CgeB
MKIAVFGLSITSSWGNGHATTYRGLLREMANRGHEILFLERDVPWYSQNRDLLRPPYCRTVLYSSLDMLHAEYAPEICEADCVIVGSYVMDGIELGEWLMENATGITAFYDIDTPVTMAALAAGNCSYLSKELIPNYSLYLSFTGGPTLTTIEQQYRSPAARALYCSVDPELHYPLEQEPSWDLGYLGTYSSDRQPGVDRLLCRPAAMWSEGRFVVAGPQYPTDIAWPENTERIEHLPPQSHRGFYCSQRFTLNVTREQMQQAGYSPSVRLFEAAACGVPIISDHWSGLEEFFVPGEEILVPSGTDDVLSILKEMPEDERRAIAGRARNKVLRGHTAACRAAELERYLNEVRS